MTRVDPKLTFDELLHRAARRGLPEGMKRPVLHVARECGVSHTHLYSLRKGLIDQPTEETLAAIAAGLGESVEQVRASIDLSRKNAVLR